MNTMIFAKVLVVATLYLELQDEDAINADTAVQGLEDLTGILQDLTKEEIKELDGAVQEIALEYSGKEQALIKSMIGDYGLLDDED